MIESNMLQILIALSHSDSISKAAQELNVTQSAVSQGLKNLEKKLGLEVVARHGKNVVLTEAGKKLARVAKQYFKRVEDTVGEIREEKQSMRGRIHLGTLVGLGKSWISHRSMEFIKNYPELEFKVSLDYPEDLIKKFEVGDVDCLVLPEYLVPNFAEKWELHDEHSTLVFPNNKKFPITIDTELKDLVKYPIIFFEDNDPLFYRWCKDRFKNVPKQIKPRLTVNSFGQMIHAVHEGVGIAVVPTHVFSRSYFKDEVKTLGKKAEMFNNTVCFACHPEEADNMKIKEVYQFLKEGMVENDHK